MPSISGLFRPLACLTVLALLGAAGCPGCNPDDLTDLYPLLRVSPESVNLNPVPVAQDTEVLVTIENPSGVPLFIPSIGLSSDGDPAFVISAAPDTVDEGGVQVFRVDPYGSIDVEVTVRPIVLGTLSTTLVIDAEETAQPNRAEIPIEVTARDLGLPDIEVSPDALAFDVVGQGSVVRGTVTIANTGVRDLIIDETVFVPDDEDQSPIVLTVPIQPGWRIGPAQSISVDLAFAPLDTEPHSGVLHIKSNDPDEGEVLVPVSGQGSVCPVAVATLLDDPDEIRPLDTVRFDGSESYVETPDTEIVAYEWTLEQRPIGSTTALSSVVTDRTEVVADIAGDYQVRLTVIDNRGVRSCEDAVVRFTAVPDEDLHLQLVWDHPRADLDLHLLREGGEPFDHDGDVYFSNRTPDWFPDAPESNPTLDADDDGGYGPENINIITPLPGSTWTVLVHYWNANTDGDVFTTASLRIYARGQQIADVSHGFEADQTMWHAIQIAWPMDPTAMPELTQIGLVENYPRPF